MKVELSLSGGKLVGSLFSMFTPLVLGANSRYECLDKQGLVDLRLGTYLQAVVVCSCIQIQYHQLPYNPEQSSPKAGFQRCLHSKSIRQN